MAIIERPTPALTTPAPVVVTPASSYGVFRRPVHSTGWRSWVFTIDHKKLGIMYGVTAMFFFVLGGIEALLIRAQLAGPNGTILSAETYNQMFTMHATTMIFLFVMPMVAAFANYLLPLQIGARDVAFPRINAFGSGRFCSPASSSTRRGSSAARRRRLVHVRAELACRSHRRHGVDFWASACRSPASPR
jgi:cytochrome c oxidase subunit 1